MKNSKSCKDSRKGSPAWGGGQERRQRPRGGKELGILKSQKGGWVAGGEGMRKETKFTRQWSQHGTPERLHLVIQT